jgi:hypothetical protein
VIPTLVVDALAAYRLTRLVTADVITKDLRGRLIAAVYDRAGASSVLLATAEQYGWDEAVAADDDPPKLATLVTCRWCTGVYVAAGVVLARQLAPRAWGPVADMLAVAAAAALVAGMED